MRFYKLSLGFVAIALGSALLLASIVSFRTGEPGANLGARASGETARCSDFASWDAANDFFSNAAGEEGSASLLDTNQNGVPCEMLIRPNERESNRHDVICDDFRHREEASLFFQQHGDAGEDHYRLDADGDGVPCEWLPSYDDFDEVILKFERDQTPDNRSKSDRDCGDFDTWQEANRFFIDSGGPGRDPHNLDGDDNGVPCESLPGAP